MACLDGRQHDLAHRYTVHVSGVGKSCILLRFSDDSFQSSFITTIGCDWDGLVSLAMC